MEILIIGAGVIGTIYGWQLQKAGCHVTHLVRKSKIELYKSSGILMKCLDLRNSKNRMIEEEYTPNFVETISDNNEFDFILVAVNSNQLEDILHMLNATQGKAHIVFLQNMRLGDDVLIAEHLDKSRYFIAYPFKAGGGRKENLVDGVIFGMPMTNTVIGEVDGIITNRVKEFYHLQKNFMAHQQEL